MKKSDMLTFTISAREALRVYTIISRTNGDCSTDLYKELKALLDPKQEIYNKYIEEFPGIGHINYYGIQYTLEAEVFKEKSDSEKQLDEISKEMENLKNKLETLREVIENKKEF